MLRLILFLIGLSCAILGMLFVLEDDYIITVDTASHYIELSVIALSVATCGAFLSILLCLRVCLWLWSLPEKMHYHSEVKGKERTIHMIGDSIHALAMDDTTSIKRLVQQLKARVPGHPMITLLGLRLSQIDSHQAFGTQLLEDSRKEKATRLIALRGLVQKAWHEKQWAQAVLLLEEAYQYDNKAHWVLQMLLQAYQRQSQWEQAVRVTKSVPGGFFQTKEAQKRQLSVLYFMQAQSCLEQTSQQQQYMTFLRLARKADVNFLPVIIALIQHHLKEESMRQTPALLQEGWKISPTPALLAAAVDYCSRLPAKKALSAAEKIVASRANEWPSTVLLARIALEHGLVERARSTVAPMLKGPDLPRDVVCLMVSLEKHAESPANVIDQWMEEALAAPSTFYPWQCQQCGHHQAEWSFFCSHCDAMDPMALVPITASTKGQVMQEEALVFSASPIPLSRPCP